ncbi:MAG: protein-disulfide reductase DsbD family protein [Gammaproteobacteria bacterium]|nr:protein-disulfide reductase DsbD family protein [Gammaproteobacteria bacterium]HJO12643.1 protein-disulfide reductase DsbD family protein [Gammaproteobacteria bacterium]
MRAPLTNSLILLGLLLPGLYVQAEVFTTDQIEVELISETTNVVPGETLWLAIRLQPIENWHTYWKFGGDSGLATETSEWQLPAGVTTGDIVWPIPEWDIFPGTNLVSFVYEHEVFLTLPVSVPASYSGSQFDLTTKIDWQVCDEICIPGDASFSLSLPVAEAAEIDTRWQTAFAETRASLPLTDHSLAANFNVHDGKFNVMVDAGSDLFADVEEAYFYPTQRRIMKYEPYREVLVEDQRIQISSEQHRRMPADLANLEGLLTVADEQGNWRGYEINPVRTQVAWNEQIEVELLAETANIVPGEQTWLGIRLEAAEGWHTYWKLGGDSDELTQTLDWTAPVGTEIGEIRWPAPYWIPFQGSDLVNYGYEGQVVLPIPVTVPENVEGEIADFSTTVKWYVCDLICISGEQRLDLSLPVGEVAELDANNAALAAQAREQVPARDHELEFLIVAAGERVSLGFQSPEPIFAGVTDAWFFPDRHEIISNGPVRDVTVQNNLIQITHGQHRRMPEDLSDVYGILVVADEQGNRSAYEFVDPAADANFSTIIPLASAVDGGADSGSAAGGGGSVLLFMLFALMGGMILNLMPCVFPVLSLKALSFAKNAGESQQKQRMDGLVYTAGVIVAFVALASILIALRAAGERIGWAFQFQQPWFLAFMVYLFFLMALSLSGVFEIGTGMMGVGSSLTEKKGYKGSFFTGVLATTVATPCTAPFMGPALGFALTQNWAVAMLIFVSLGFGMALPILALSFSPALSRYMPNPGPWMETFKQFMAFLLYGSALFFLWVLGVQVGVTGMALVLGACILLAFAAWLYQKRHSIGPSWRTANTAIGAACVIAAIYLVQTPFLATAPVSQAASLDADGNPIQQDFEVFSRARLDELQAAGRPVFVNMTAAWCITCLANDQTTLNTDRVKQVMADNDITYMKGDWTNEDPEITEVLERFNRPSVPLYVLYPGDTSKEPEILPQILTPGIVTEAFENI